MQFQYYTKMADCKSVFLHTLFNRLLAGTQHKYTIKQGQGCALSQNLFFMGLHMFALNVLFLHKK